jgi:hypothetical protein
MLEGFQKTAMQRHVSIHLSFVCLSTHHPSTHSFILLLVQPMTFLRSNYVPRDPERERGENFPIIKGKIVLIG